MGWKAYIFPWVVGLSLAGTAFADSITAGCAVALASSGNITAEALGAIGNNFPPLTDQERDDLRITDGMLSTFPAAEYRGRGGQSLVFTIRSGSGDLLALRVPRNLSHEGIGRMSRAYRTENRISHSVNQALAHPAVTEARTVGVLHNLTLPTRTRSSKETRIKKVPVLASTWVDGRDLSKDLELLGTKTTPRRLLSAMFKIVQQVAHVHAAGWVHGDLKPGNILVAGHRAIDEHSEFLLLDLGYTSSVHGFPPGWDMTRGTVFGTMGFMSPNRRRGGEAEYSDDLFSLARTFALMILGSQDLIMRDARDPRDDPSFRMPMSPYSIMEDPISNADVLGFQILSTLSYHPWKDTESLLTAIAWAEKALVPNSSVDFYSHYYWPQVLEPYFKSSPREAADLIWNAAELKDRFGNL